MTGGGTGEGTSGGTGEGTSGGTGEGTSGGTGEGNSDLAVIVVRTGGLAAMRTCVRMDTRDLASSDAEVLRSAVDAVDALGESIDSAAGHATGTGRGADRFRYEICVRRGDQEQRVDAAETELSEPARSLVRHLFAHGTRVAD